MIRRLYELADRFGPTWRLLNRLQPRAMVEAYWRQPWDVNNEPASYAADLERSRVLVDLIARHASPDASVLEVGCNVGRNLHCLREAGFHHLAGVDISAAALAALRETYPELATIPLYEGRAHEVLPRLADREYGVVFTRGVLEHIHPSVERQVFDGMARVAANLVVTVEPEPVPGDTGRHWRVFLRGYRPIFEQRGFEQIDEDVDVGGAIARVFSRV